MALMDHRPSRRRHDLPPGYPREFERELRLADGRTVLIRPILPDDSAQLADAIRTADPDTLRRRFLGMPPQVTTALSAHLCVVDYEKRFALVAADPRSCRGVAVARYEASAKEGVADVAVVVAPAWRRAGLATALVGLLAEAAIERGIHTFGARYFAGNRPVAALVDRTGTGRRLTVEDGIAEATVVLDLAGVPARAGAAR